MLTTACCLEVGLGLRLGLDFVYGCAHVFVLLSLVVVKHNYELNITRRYAVRSHPA